MNRYVFALTCFIEGLFTAIVSYELERPSVLIYGAILFTITLIIDAVNS